MCDAGLSAQVPRSGSRRASSGSRSRMGPAATFAQSGATPSWHGRCFGLTATQSLDMEAVQPHSHCHVVGRLPPGLATTTWWSETT